MENTETKNETEESTYEKGNKLEKDFALFLKRELNWSKVRVGAHLPGKMNRKGASIDVIGERLDSRGEKFEMGSIISVVISLVCLVYGIIWAIYDIDNGGILLIIYSLITAGASMIFLVQSGKYNKENAWAECKNLKSKANINQIDKSLREKKDYEASGDKEYKFEYHYFVSASGYIENALKYAIENNIICYEKSGDTFKKSGYWE